MAPEHEFRTDLYKGTAAFYDRYRPPYPEPLLNDLCRRVPLSGGGRLLDLACGTGQIALALAGQFAEVWAVDQEDEFVAYGRAKAENLGVDNTAWLTASAEDVDLGCRFELITIGNAFHRLNRQLVAERSLSWLRPGGCVALEWGDTPERGHEPWQQALRDLLAAWITKVGATTRVPAGWREAIDRDPHDEVLRQVGYEYVGKFEFTETRTWSVESLTGYVYSTAFLNQEALGGDVTAFERELAEVLGYFEASGVFRETTSYAYELARMPV